MEIEREFNARILANLAKPQVFFDVVLGPRQVGKTTGVTQILRKAQGPNYYVSADGAVQRPQSWLMEQWLLAKSKAPDCLLVIDEIQKVENWAEGIKQLWDEQRVSGGRIGLIVLGSSSIQLQKGLSESLAGRYRMSHVGHWSAMESELGYKLNLNQFLHYGGYPGSYPLISNRLEWLSYMKNSIIDAVIGRDILSLARVKSPALFRQCFYLACSYSGQEISYTKLLGQLQSRGNTELVKHYLELFEHAFLLKQLFKYSNKRVLSRSSSPKILTLCPALYSVTLDADLNQENIGRSFEIMIGALLALNPGELFYWREKNLEVDYVYKFGHRLWAIEVKSGRKKASLPGLVEFKKRFPQADLMLITPENYRNQLAAIKEVPDVSV